MFSRRLRYYAIMALVGAVVLSPGARLDAESVQHCAEWRTHWTKSSYWQRVTTTDIRRCFAHDEDEYGWTPLHAAAAWGNAETVSLLFALGSKLNARTSERLISFRQATPTGKAELIPTRTMPLTADGSDNSIPIHRTPLHVAAVAANADTVTALLNAGAKMEAESAFDSTPLHYAGNAKTVKALIAAGAKVDARDMFGGPQHAAAAAGRVDALNALIAAGANIKARNAYDFTPLEFAVREGEAESVKTLVFAGADVNMQNMEGKTPLHLAAIGGDAAIINALLDAGADQTIRTKDGLTAADLVHEFRRELRGTKAWRRLEAESELK